MGSIVFVHWDHDGILDDHSMLHREMWVATVKQILNLELSIFEILYFDIHLDLPFGPLASMGYLSNSM